MKHVQLFENFGETPTPSSITIELLPDWLGSLKSQRSGNLTGHAPFGSEFKLHPGRAVKIGSGPYELDTDRRVFYWATYYPEINEIQVNNSFCFGEGIQKHQDLDWSFVDAPQMAWEIDNKNRCIFTSGFYSKFENGFSIGEVDHRGYFRIVNVE
jgi:hypothetical protein